MRKGFLYLVAIMDWFTRKVLAWRISNTLEADFCLEALNEAIYKFGAPEIMNTDQGSQFTSFDWTDRLKQAKTKISLDGKARYLDNIFIERLWRSLKYECVYGPARMGNRIAGQGRSRALDHLLQPPAAPRHSSGNWSPGPISDPPQTWRTTARRGLLQPHRNRSAGAGSSLSQPENCPKIGE